MSTCASEQSSWDLFWELAPVVASSLACLPPFICLDLVFPVRLSSFVELDITARLQRPPRGLDDRPRRPRIAASCRSASCEDPSARLLAGRSACIVQCRGRVLGAIAGQACDDASAMRIPPCGLHIGHAQAFARKLRHLGSSFSSGSFLSQWQFGLVSACADLQ